jgi:hypothetical protein
MEQAYALLLASHGAKIVVNDFGGDLKGEGVSAGPAQEVAREIKETGGDIYRSSHPRPLAHPEALSNDLNRRAETSRDQLCH